jgi:hypothetical protein
VPLCAVSSASQLDLGRFSPESPTPSLHEDPTGSNGEHDDEHPQRPNIPVRVLMPRAADCSANEEQHNDSEGCHGSDAKPDPVLRGRLTLRSVVIRPGRQIVHCPHGPRFSHQRNVEDRRANPGPTILEVPICATWGRGRPARYRRR